MRHVFVLTVMLFLGAALAPLARADGPPRLVATIKPVHALLAAVTNGITTPDLLLQGAGSSPHGFALRPSDMRKVAGADLLVWIGPGLESFLVRARDATGVQTLTLMDIPGLHLRRDTDDTDDHGHDNGHDDSHGHDHDNNGVDPHIWLAPDNARAMTLAIAADLATRDPARAAAYRANAERYVRGLNDLETRIRIQLAPHAKTPFAVYHDGYGYLIDAFGLTSVGAVTLSPDRLAGAAHVNALRQDLADRKARCLFIEPGIEAKRVRALTDGLGVRIGTLDPLGATLPAGPDHYEQMMLNMADALADCLGAAPTAG